MDITCVFSFGSVPLKGDTHAHVEFRHAPRPAPPQSSSSRHSGVVALQVRGSGISARPVLLGASGARQSEAFTLPRSEYCHFGQDKHVASLSAPTVGENFPNVQSAQGELPLIALKVPALHAAQSSPFFPVNPALHVQLEIVAIPAEETEFCGHELHADSDTAPIVSENDPRGHKEQMS